LWCALRCSRPHAPAHRSGQRPGQRRLSRPYRARRLQRCSNTRASFSSARSKFAVCRTSMTSWSAKMQRSGKKRTRRKRVVNPQATHSSPGWAVDPEAGWEGTRRGASEARHRMRMVQCPQKSAWTITIPMLTSRQRKSSANRSVRERWKLLLAFGRRAGIAATANNRTAEQRRQVVRSHSRDFACRAGPPAAPAHPRLSSACWCDGRHGTRRNLISRHCSGRTTGSGRPGQAALSVTYSRCERWMIDPAGRCNRRKRSGNCMTGQT